jgi:hypothetical protein
LCPDAVSVSTLIAINFYTPCIAAGDQSTEPKASGTSTQTGSDGQTYTIRVSRRDCSILRRNNFAFPDESERALYSVEIWPRSEEAIRRSRRLVVWSGKVVDDSKDLLKIGENEKTHQFSLQETTKIQKYVIKWAEK